MIKDIADFTGTGTLQADVAIIGTGLAGVHAAKKLAASGLKVAFLESGRELFDTSYESLNDLIFTGKPHRQPTPGTSLHPYLDEQYRGRNRLRMLGGTSNIWTGKWRVYTQPDIDPHAWIPGSGWPITIQELRPAYEAIAKEYGIGDVFTAIEESSVVQMQEKLSPHGLQLAVHYWQGETLRTVGYFKSELETDERIQTVLRATATELVLGHSGDRVSTVRCQSLEGHTLNVEADWVIMAMGGVEGARLLLASNKQRPEGLGNGNDLVGRYYQEHAKSHDIRLIPDKGLEPLIHKLQYWPRPRFCLAFSLTPEVLEKHGLLHHGVFCNPEYENPLARAWNLVSGNRGLRDENGELKHYRVTFANEQAPNRDSRLYLGDEVDAMGVPKLVVDWRFTELDTHSIETSCRLLTEAFAKAGLGKMIFDVDPLTLDSMMDAAHPTGATRMANSPDEGVVDKECKVFGVDNLFIASSSVFPTSSVYSPTYTILAFAHRIADRISKLAGSSAIATPSLGG